MSKYFDFIYPAVMAVAGIVMAIAPKLCTKKESREDADRLSRTRKIGLFLLAAAVCIAAVQPLWMLGKSYFL